MSKPGLAAIFALTIALGLLLVPASAIAQGSGGDSGPLQFSRSDVRMIRNYFTIQANLDALSPALKKYLTDNATLSREDRRSLMENRPLPGKLNKLTRPAPSNLTDHLTVGGGDIRIVFIGRNIVLLQSKKQIVRDVVWDIRMRL